MEQGWTLNDVDEMDIFYYFDLLLYKINKQQKKEQEKANKIIDML